MNLLEHIHTYIAIVMFKHNFIFVIAENVKTPTCYYRVTFVLTNKIFKNGGCKYSGIVLILMQYLRLQTFPI